jgi:hypothetical protein
LKRPTQDPDRNRHGFTAEDALLRLRQALQRRDAHADTRTGVRGTEAGRYRHPRQEAADEAQGTGLLLRRHRRQLPEKTTKAVKLFERAYGKEETGNATVSLQKTLFSRLRQAYSGATATLLKPEYIKLSPGDSGDRVKKTADDGSRNWAISPATSAATTANCHRRGQALPEEDRHQAERHRQRGDAGAAV